MVPALRAAANWGKWSHPERFAALALLAGFVDRPQIARCDPASGWEHARKERSTSRACAGAGASAAGPHKELHKMAEARG
jgi:hypothetical protein